MIVINLRFKSSKDKGQKTSYRCITIKLMRTQYKMKNHENGMCAERNITHESSTIIQAALGDVTFVTS